MTFDPLLTMKCIVCKLTKEKGEGRRNWVFTAERTPMSRTGIVFKLFEITKQEFPASGSMCKTCYELVAQIDSLQFQIQEITKTLRSRINCCATPEEYLAAHEGDESEDIVEEEEEEEMTEQEEEEEEELVRNRKRRRRDEGRKKKNKGRRKTIIGGGSVIKEERIDEEMLNGHDNRQEEKTTTSEPDRSAENLDFNITITKSTRGHDQLVYEGYTYLKLTHQPVSGDVAKWKCTSYYSTKTNCKAKLNTTLDGLCILLDSKTEHNHPPPDDAQLQIIMFREQVKQIANNHPDMKPSEILASAQMLLGTPTSLGIKDESIMRYIQRIKSKNKQQQQHLQQQQQQQQHPEEEEEQRLVSASNSLGQEMNVPVNVNPDPSLESGGPMMPDTTENLVNTQ